jgi:hypothetical protein
MNKGHAPTSKIEDAAVQLKNILNFHLPLAYFSQTFHNYLLKFKIFLDKPHLFKLALACKLIRPLTLRRSR